MKKFVTIVLTLSLVAPAMATAKTHHHKPKPKVTLTTAQAKNAVKQFADSLRLGINPENFTMTPVSQVTTADACKSVNGSKQACHVSVTSEYAGILNPQVKQGVVCAGPVGVSKQGSKITVAPGLTFVCNNV